MCLLRRESDIDSGIQNAARAVFGAILAYETLFESVKTHIAAQDFLYTKEQEIESLQQDLKERVVQKYGD